MAYELSWQFDPNRSYTPPDAVTLTKYQIWYLASFLMGDIGGASGAGLWTYQGSSDGTNGEMSAVKGNWKWGTPGTFDATKIVQITATPATSAHSWIVLRSPVMPDGGYTYMLISAYHGTTAGFSIHTSRSVWSLAGTTTFQPTSPTWAPASATTASSLSNDADVVAHTFNGCLATTGQFHVFDVKTGTGALLLAHLAMWAPVLGYQTADTSPYYFYRTYDAANGIGYPINFATPNAARNSVRSGNGLAAWFNANLLALIQPTLVASYKDFLSGQIWDLPFFVFATDNANFAHARGRVQDIAWSIWSAGPVYQAAAGTVFKESGSVKYVSLGGLIVPFNSALAM